MKRNRPAIGGSERRYVDLDRRRDRLYWTKTFDVEEAALREAIEAVGPAVEDVRTYLDLKAIGAAGRRPAKRATPNR